MSFMFRPPRINGSRASGWNDLSGEGSEVCGTTQNTEDEIKIIHKG